MLSPVNILEYQSVIKTDENISFAVAEVNKLQKMFRKYCVINFKKY